MLAPIVALGGGGDQKVQLYILKVPLECEWPYSCNRPPPEFLRLQCGHCQQGGEPLPFATTMYPTPPSHPSWFYCSSTEEGGALWWYFTIYTCTWQPELKRPDVHTDDIPIIERESTAVDIVTRWGEFNLYTPNTCHHTHTPAPIPTYMYLPALPH